MFKEKMQVILISLDSLDIQNGRKIGDIFILESFVYNTPSPRWKPICSNVVLLETQILPTNLSKIERLIYNLPATK